MFTKFRSLPQEIQDQIWTFTLPGPRVFNVDIAFDDGCHTGILLGPLNVNSLPVTLQICYDSRAAALREGFFLEHSFNESLFFIPETDILYFGPGSIYLLQRNDPISIPGLDRVLNLGFGPFYLHGEDYRIISEEEYWRKVVKHLYAYMPNLKTLNHIFPLLPKGPLCKSVLSPLPGDVKVEYFGPPSDALYNKPWTDWKISIMNALEGSEHTPEICGWRFKWK